MVVVYFDFFEFVGGCFYEIGFGLEGFEVMIDGNGFGDCFVVVEFENGDFVVWVYVEENWVFCGLWWLC